MHVHYQKINVLISTFFFKKKKKKKKKKRDIKKNNIINYIYIIINYVV